MVSTFFSIISWCLDEIFAPLRDITIFVLQSIKYCRKLNASTPQNTHSKAKAEGEYPSGPLLAFSYAGMLWSYYLGAVAFFRDHFDLHQSNVCLSGISAGCSSIMVIFLDLTIQQGFEFGLEWNKLFNSRFLKFFCLSTSQTLHMIYDKFIKFGINDDVLRKQYDKYGANSVHFGVTAVSFSNLKIFHLLLNNFNGLKQTIYAALCSMRILPFFRSFGKYNGYYCCDDALSSNYSIPEIYRNNADKVIKIGILSKNLVSADISPKYNFYLNEFVIAGDLNDNLIRFNRGYKDAAQFCNILMYIKKGLIWNQQHIDAEQFNDMKYEAQWNDYIDDNIQQWNIKIISHINNL